MLESGLTIRLMDMAPMYIQMELLMKDTVRMISSMAMVLKSGEMELNTLEII